MALAKGAGSRLWRYNYQVLVGTGYWVLVLPIAASQVVTLWMMSMAAGFDQTVALRIAELMTPILGAFLVSHSLAPEYRSGIGAVLASKPVSMHRVITIRIGLALTAAVLLTATTLGICSVGLRAIDLGPPLLAALPSLFFLSALALLFATIFRNALGGFTVAAGIWVLDLTLGYDIHPLLSLQGFTALQDKDPLAQLWLTGKVLLVVAALVLLWVHGRILPRIHQPAERRDVIRTAALVGTVWLAYCVSGAAVMVGYAYLNRGHLDRADVTWLRRQLRVYGPVPVAKAFGPAFSVYVADVPPSRGEASPAAVRVTQLHQALQRWPGSLWADGIAFAIGHERETLSPPASVPDYFAVADRYASSPFAPKALAAILRISEGVPQADRLRAARRLLADYPTAPEVETAAGTFRD
ncbi:MAG TPA: hypothetical protein VFU47_15005, partial [Armatimonadota bacterium]|nr:hypothetical protein [Armatimonadota bacterium]